MIHEAKFGEMTVRFAFRDGVIYVSRDDIQAVVVSAAPDGAVRRHAHDLIETACQDFLEAEDNRSIATGIDQIGVGVHAFAAAQILNSIAELREQVKEGCRSPEELQEWGRRVAPIFLWYIHAFFAASKAFGVDFRGTIGMAVQRLDRTNPPFVCTVSFDHDAGVWVGICDEIPLATEAASYDELVERVWDIAPEILKDNGAKSAADVRIRFVNDTAAPDSIAL